MFDCSKVQRSISFRRLRGGLLYHGLIRHEPSLRPLSPRVLISEPIIGCVAA